MGEGNDFLYTGETFGDGNAKVDTQLDMGSGNDTVDIKGSSYLTKIDLGEGNDKLRIAREIQNRVQIEAGTGNDHVHIAGQANFYAVKNSSIDMGDGNDVLVIGYNISRDSKINLGKGNDAFHYGYNGIDGKVDGGEGTDIFRVFNTASQNVTIHTDDIANFERVDISGEKDFVNTFFATDQLFKQGNYLLRSDNITKDMLLDGDKSNSVLDLENPIHWTEHKDRLVGSDGAEIKRGNDNTFVLSDGRIVKGTDEAGDTKYYYANKNGDATTERYEGNIYKVYTTANDEHQRLLVDLDITKII